jgi:2OG-Fe(II) oxygenase superfamily
MMVASKKTQRRSFSPSQRSVVAIQLTLYFAMTTLSTAASTIGAAFSADRTNDNGKINEVDRKGGGGGGVVAEFKRNQEGGGFDPIQYRSHLYHAIEGMHRYPNYLQRWQSESEMDALEAALQLQLQMVRSQREGLRQKRENIAKVLVVVTPSNNSGTWTRPPPSTWEDVEAIFDTAFGRHILPQCKQYNLADVLQGRVDVHYNVASLTKLMTEEAVPEVFGLPILDRAFCQTLQDHLANVMERYDPSVSIMNLDWIELGWLNDLIFHVVIRPIARHLYGGLELDWRHGYLARYREPVIQGQRSRLVKHTDDSAVTLNIGLNEDYDGGAVRFGEFRGESPTAADADDDENDDGNDYYHDVGKGILHSGRHFHAVTPVTRGERWVWILWSRAWHGDRSVTCPCCWLNNRGGNTFAANKNNKNQCICGPAWN